MHKEVVHLASCATFEVVARLVFDPQSHPNANRSGGLVFGRALPQASVGAVLCHWGRLHGRSLNALSHSRCSLAPGQ